MSSLFPSFPYDLCNRALSSPSSITPSERAFLEGRESPATADRLYRTATSLPLSALVAKSLSAPSTLTPHEAHVLAYGPVQQTPTEWAAYRNARSALTTEQMNLLKRVCRVISDKDESRARRVAFRILQSHKAEEAKKRQQQPSATSELSRTSSSGFLVLPWERADWTSIIHEKKYSSWGLPVLRTAYADPAAWLAFRTRFSALAAHEIHCITDDATIASTFHIQYIEDEDSFSGAGRAYLISYYNKRLAAGQGKEEVVEGFDWGVFVSADEHVLEIFGEEEFRGNWIVPVWDAHWKEEDEKRKWRGALAMMARSVFGALVPRLLRGEFRPLKVMAAFAVDI